jgi:hypothetical protein
LYIIWVKIDETLPWIELKGEYQTRAAAKKAIDEILNDIKIRTVKASENRESVKAMATAKATR